MGFFGFGVCSLEVQVWVSGVCRSDFSGLGFVVLQFKLGFRGCVGRIFRVCCFFGLRF